MTTSTKISNMALSRLPAGSIVNLDEDSVQARACKMHYQQTLDHLLEMGEWRFARKTVALALQDTNDRDARWLYRYAAPADMALIVKLWDENLSLPEGYEFIGGSLYCNVLTAKLDYVVKSESAAPYTAMFITALVAALAVAVCVPITKSYKREDQLIAQAEQALQRALAANANANSQTYGNFVPETLRERMGLTGLEQLRFPGPEAVYPDFDPLAIYEEALGD